MPYALLTRTADGYNLDAQADAPGPNSGGQFWCDAADLPAGLPVGAWSSGGRWYVRTVSGPDAQGGYQTTDEDRGPVGDLAASIGRAALAYEPQGPAPRELPPEGVTVPELEACGCACGCDLDHVGECCVQAALALRPDPTKARTP